jgi:hypothetical protein
VRDFRAIGDVELSKHVAAIGDAVAPFMAPPDPDQAGWRSFGRTRREEIGFSHFAGDLGRPALVPGSRGEDGELHHLGPLGVSSVIFGVCASSTLQPAAECS